MRTMAASLGGALLLVVTALTPARAEVPMSGTFKARFWCQGYQSIRKGTNPGRAKVKFGQTYEVVAKNKPDATYYRVVIEGAEPAERWVRALCGHVDITARPRTASPSVAAATPGASAGASASDPSRKRATHVLAMGWEPAFCAKHADKSECREMTSTGFAATHLSLHGLWPQPRGTQYCSVPPELQQTDRNHDWNGLPEPEMSAATLQRLSAVMPGVQSRLQRHEWIVHGTCFGSNADGYFARAAGLAEAVNASTVSQLFAGNTGRVVSATAIRAAFDEAFGAGAGERVAISCGGRGDTRKITELVVNLAGDVKGGAGLRDLIQAAPPVAAGCPGGLIDTAPAR